MGCVIYFLLVFLAWQIGTHLHEIIQSMFWQDFGSNFLATVLGVFLALWIDRARVIKQEKKEIKIKNTMQEAKKQQLLSLLKSTLVDNLNIIDNISDSINSTELPLENVDLTHLDSTKALRYELINDIELNSQIDSISHSLGIIHKALEMSLNMKTSILADSIHYQTMLTELKKFIKKNIEPLRSQLITTISILENMDEN